MTYRYDNGTSPSLLGGWRWSVTQKPGEESPVWPCDVTQLAGGLRVVRRGLLPINLYLTCLPSNRIVIRKRGMLWPPYVALFLKWQLLYVHTLREVFDVFFFVPALAYIARWGPWLHLLLNSSLKVWVYMLVLMFKSFLCLSTRSYFHNELHK